MGHLLKKNIPPESTVGKKKQTSIGSQREFPATPRHDVFQNSNWRHIKPTSQISQETGGESLGFEGTNRVVVGTDFHKMCLRLVFLKFDYIFTLKGTNISHRKIIFKSAFAGDMLVPWRVSLILDI